MAAKGGVVWLATSSAEIARARALLKALTPAGVLDELGFLVLQGAFADRLYPATNTIMTRARYLVFVPAIYRYLEESGKARGKDADRVARDLQFELSNVLRANEKRGVIGVDAGRDIVRPPSNVYWNALADLGIATQRVAEATYQERLTRGLVGPRLLRDDDERAHPDESESLWDPDFPTGRLVSDTGSFPSNASFQLTRREAKQLWDRYARVRAAEGGSLLAHLVSWGQRRGNALTEVTFPWDTPEQPAGLRAIVDHARRLSLFARGAVLQYHRLLVERRGDDDPGISEAFEAWWQHSRAVLRDWKTEELFAFALKERALRQGDRQFIEQWRACVVNARSSRVLLESSEARGLIASREYQKRRSKARLRSAHHLKIWGLPESYQPEDLYQLTYRHGTGHQFAKDIVGGLTGDSE